MEKEVVSTAEREGEIISYIYSIYNGQNHVDADDGTDAPMPTRHKSLIRRPRGEYLNLHSYSYLQQMWFFLFTLYHYRHSSLLRRRQLLLPHAHASRR